MVAVSGGPDSMALLHALWELRARLGLTLEVAAVDHGLRADAHREVDLVRERAEALGLPFAAVARRRRGGTARPPGRVPAGRRARRAPARAGGAGPRARGRPRGAGPPGRRPGRDRPVSHRSRHRRRGPGRHPVPPRHLRAPAAGRARAPQILRYLRRRSIPFVEDPSNADPRFARARIRHRILPALAQENPRVAEALRALAAAARAGRPAPPRGTPARWCRRCRGARRRRSRGSPRARRHGAASTSRAAGASRSRTAGCGVHDRRSAQRGRQAAPSAGDAVVIDAPGHVPLVGRGRRRGARAGGRRQWPKELRARRVRRRSVAPGRWSCARGGPGTGCGRAAAAAAASFPTS